MIDEVLYFCAGLYDKGDRKEFHPISPTGAGSAPYVTFAGKADSLFTLAKHHSSLYRLFPGEKKAVRSQAGEGRDKTDPKEVELNEEQLRAIRQAGETPWMYEKIKIETMEDLDRWYDDCTLDERECFLKTTLTGVALEKWFSDLDDEDQKAALEEMKGKEVYIEVTATHG